MSSANAFFDNVSSESDTQAGRLQIGRLLSPSMQKEILLVVGIMV